MKNSIALSLILLTACGMRSRDNDLIGQVKRVKEKTPIICDDYTEADLSLGVIRNGVGSISQEDVLLYVPNKADHDTLVAANKSGAIVDVKYDEMRGPFHGFCVPTDWVTGVSIVTDNAGSAEAGSAK